LTDERWAEIGRYAGQFDADFHRSMLEAAGIPVLVKGPLTGAFGPGFVGWTPEGVTLFVPASALDEARALLIGEQQDEDTDQAEDG
jgi:hypothetical protein